MALFRMTTSKLAETQVSQKIVDIFEYSIVKNHGFRQFGARANA